MTSATSKKPTKEKLSAMAEAVRKELSFRGQDDVYKHAVEIGYLAASADGRVDDEEKQRIVEAVDRTLRITGEQKVVRQRDCHRRHFGIVGGVRAEAVAALHIPKLNECVLR